MNTIMANVSVDGVSMEDKGEVPVCAKIWVCVDNFSLAQPDIQWNCNDFLEWDQLTFENRLPHRSPRNTILCLQAWHICRAIHQSIPTVPVAGPFPQDQQPIHNY